MEVAVIISCPNCSYEREVNLRPSPPRTVSASCPKCKQGFTFDVGASGAGKRGSVPAAAAVERQAPQATEPSRAVIPPEAPALPKAGPAAPVVLSARPQAWADTHRLSYHGKWTTLLGMHIMNNLLTVLTLGFYSFWGKVKIRKYLLGSTELMGERLTYTGTGKELLAGWWKASIVIALAYGGPQILARFVHPAFGVLLLPIMMVLIPFALASSRRYRLSRTTWHGVRFSFGGHPLDYVKLHIKGSLLTFFTLGFYSPYFHARKEGFWRSNTGYGTGSFNYTGEGKDLKKDFLKAMLLQIPTLGLYWFWYKAKVARYDWANTSFGGLTFSSNLTGGRLLTFQAANILLVVLTLGFALPLVKARNIGFLSAHLNMKGDVEFDRLSQTPPVARAVGDGLASIFDVDLGM
jgi:uncharacterized membrane protein YjgN (DUF898 family)